MGSKTLSYLVLYKVYEIPKCMVVLKVVLYEIPKYLVLYEIWLIWLGSVAGIGSRPCGCSRSLLRKVYSMEYFQIPFSIGSVERREIEIGFLLEFT